MFFKPKDPTKSPLSYIYYERPEGRSAAAMEVSDSQEQGAYRWEKSSSNRSGRGRTDNLTFHDINFPPPSILPHSLSLLILTSTVVE